MLVLLNMRLWPLRIKVIISIIAISVCCGCVILLAVNTGQPWPVAAGASVAAASLVSAAYSAYSAFVRAKRKDTLSDWANWSDSNKAARRVISAQLGTGTISIAQAEALVNDTDLVPIGASIPMDDISRREIRFLVREVLNGLERLAVGVHLGIYDTKVLRVVGGTIIVRQYKRFLPYVELLRATESETVRQEKAFTHLEVLVASLEYPNSRTDLRNAKKGLDQKRLKALK